MPRIRIQGENLAKEAFVAKWRISRAAAASCFLINEPEQLAIFWLYDLRWKLLRAGPEHVTENLGFSCARDQKNHLSSMIEDRKGKGNAESLKLFTQLAATLRDVSLRASLPGKSEAVWPSSPRPRKIRSKRGQSPSVSRKNSRNCCSYSWAAAVRLPVQRGYDEHCFSGIGTLDNRDSLAMRKLLSGSVWRNVALIAEKDMYPVPRQFLMLLWPAENRRCARSIAAGEATENLPRSCTAVSDNR